MEVLQQPVKKVKISQKFGFDNTYHPVRNSFYSHFDNKHPGVDFEVDIGTPVFAAYPGIVVRKEFHEGMGNVVGTRNGNIVILYGHLKDTSIELGQIIKAGDIVGLSGQTGSACPTPHLHFEIRDITKPTLKEMVFNPLFNKPLRDLKQNFIYTTNNDNSAKTLAFLAKRYFGESDYWRKILEQNPELSKNPYKKIKNGIGVIIPNF